MRRTSSSLCPVAATVKTAFKVLRGKVNKLEATSGGTEKSLAELVVGPPFEIGKIKSAGVIESGAEKKDEVRVTLYAAV